MRAKIYDRAGQEIAILLYEQGEIVLEGGEPWMWEALLAPIDRLEVLNPMGFTAHREERATYHPGDIRHFKLLVTRWHQVARRHGHEQWAKWVDS